MPTVSEILAREDANPGRIYFYREGPFLKAYQQSAYMFVRDCAKFKPTKKYVKAVGREIVSIGFPQGTLLKYFEHTTIVTENEDIIYISCAKADPEGFRKWFESIEVKPKADPKPKAPAAPVAPKAESGSAHQDGRRPDLQHAPIAEATVPAVPPPAQQAFSGSAPEKENSIIRRLRDFRINASSPMECMIFLGTLQQEIDKNCNCDA